MVKKKDIVLHKMLENKALPMKGARMVGSCRPVALYLAPAKHPNNHEFLMNSRSDSRSSERFHMHIVCHKHCRSCSSCMHQAKPEKNLKSAPCASQSDLPGNVCANDFGLTFPKQHLRTR